MGIRSTRVQRQSPPVGFSPPGNVLPWEFVWTAADPGANLRNNQRVTPRGVQNVGAFGPWTDFNAASAVQSYDVALPSTGFTAVIVFYPSIASTGTRSVLRTTGGGFRIEPSSTAGGVTVNVTHTAVAAGAFVATSVASHNAQPWTMVVTADGSTSKLWIRSPDGLVQFNSQTAGFSAGTGTLDLSTSIGSFGMSLAAVSNRCASDAMAAALVVNPWLVFDEEGFFTPTAAGLASVTSDLSGSYVVVGSASADRAASYVVRASASADSAASYVVRGSITSDQAASYALRGSATADRAASYALRGSATADQAANYAIRTNASLDLAAAYNVGQLTVTKDLAASFAIIGTATSDQAGAYVVRTSAAADRAGSFSIRTSATADRAATYAVRGSAQTDASAAYSVRTSAQLDLAGAFSILNAGVVLSDFGSSFVIRGSAQADAAPAYAIRASAQADRAAAYTVRASVQRDLVGAFDILNTLTASADFSAGWTITGSASRDLFVSYAVGEVLATGSPGYTAKAPRRPRAAYLRPPRFSERN